MLCIMQNCVGSGDKRAREFNFFAGIEIAIKARKVAAGNFQAQSVATQKDVAGGPEIKRDFINLPWVHQSGVLRRVTVAHAKNTFRQVLGKSVGRNVDELSGK